MFSVIFAFKNIETQTSLAGNDSIIVYAPDKGSEIVLIDKEKYLKIQDLVPVTNNLKY